ncbi:hypothetical protein [Caballeronia sp. DA-9]|uniref:hypothetical protein n=1 Tax=Caballeronia sp. DA-9 TaxID=3436237 RepID=UPI003F679A2D
MANVQLKNTGPVAGASHVSGPQRRVFEGDGEPVHDPLPVCFAVQAREPLRLGMGSVPEDGQAFLNERWGQRDAALVLDAVLPGIETLENR